MVEFVGRAAKELLGVVTDQFHDSVITVGELHVHAVAAQESLTVQGDVHVGWVLDRLTHDDEA